MTAWDNRIYSQRFTCRSSRGRAGAALATSIRQVLLAGIPVIAVISGRSQTLEEQPDTLTQ